MSNKDVTKAVRSAGLKVTHIAWPESSAPALPWCVYLLEEDSKLNADNKRWYSYPRWRVELYHLQNDETSEKKLEEALTAAFGDYDKYETWLDSEACVMTAYEFNEIGDNNG